MATETTTHKPPALLAVLGAPAHEDPEQARWYFCCRCKRPAQRGVWAFSWVTGFLRELRKCTANTERDAAEALIETTRAGAGK